MARFGSLHHELAMRRIPLALFLLSLAGPFAVGQDAKPAEHDAVKGVPRGGGWVKRHESFNTRVKEGNVDLVFIGDSITQGWEGRGRGVWQKFYGDRNAVNLGIGGDRTQHVIWRLDNGNVEGISPKLAVVMIGTNNSGSNTPEQIAEGVTRIVEQLGEKCPKTKVLLLATFPRGSTPEDKRRQVNEKSNAIVAKLADGKRVHYLDIGPKFLESDGTLSKEIMPDLLHLSEKGYTIWAESIETKVAELLGEEAASGEAGDWSRSFVEKLPASEKPVLLFDGKSLDGWVGQSETYFSVEDGEIVAKNTEENAPKASTYLMTERKYRNFRLIFESKLVTSEMHSGISLWGQAVEKQGDPYSYQGHLVMYPSGYGFYDLYRRNSIYRDKDGVAKKAGHQHDWNRMEILAIGNRIRHVVNGKLVADWTDPKPELCGTGPIGLQLHSNKVPQEVRWRGLVLTEDPEDRLVTVD